MVSFLKEFLKSYTRSLDITGSLIQARYETFDAFDSVMNGLGADRESFFRKQLFDMVDLQGKDVVEVGVGSGYNFSYYLDTHSIVGLDISENMLGKSLEEAEKLGIQDKTSLLKSTPAIQDYLKESSDITVLTYVLSASSDPGKTLKEALDITKDGGYVIILDAKTSDRKFNLGFLLNLIGGTGKLDTWRNIYYKNRVSFRIAEKKVFQRKDPSSDVYIIVLKKK